MEKIPVSKPALIRRINRKLASEGRMGHKLKKIRGQAGRSSLGEYYIVDIDKNYILETFVNLEDCGRKLGTLQQYEKLVE